MVDPVRPGVKQERLDVRVSELVAVSGVPLATVKYYLREGLLMPGAASSATQAEYGEQHVRRLALVKALAGVGLPLGRIRTIVGLVDHPADTVFETIGRALAALPPYPAEGEERSGDYPRARAVLERLGQVYEPAYPVVAQLERALAAAEDVGIRMTDERLDAYARHVRGIAEIDLDLMPTDSAESAIEYAVLGTAIYEPVLAALRRLAHQDIGAARFAGRTFDDFDTPDRQDQP
ncbi:transcriptional regulator [Prescottella equi]|nr:merr family transcriptional regulator [Prescottella equi NBRC 101255 = C 7]BDC74010.1 transcriptional regulator [Prescottella equi]SUE04318.1 merr family transcriptional regulator [Prescottella equi]SUE20240.1 merr family transcriptional regulator [Prescottella equi]